MAYPKCRSTKPIPEELKAQLGASAPASPKNDALKSVEVAVTCDDCGGAMTVRRGRRGFFLGCASYPKCKGTKEVDETTQERIEAATKEVAE
jgi:DNA topoisomerase-1